MLCFFMFILLDRSARKGAVEQFSPLMSSLSVQIPNTFVAFNSCFESVVDNDTTENV